MTSKILFGLLLSSSAYAFPWSTDMSDSTALKAYEHQIRGLPEGVVAQANLLSPQAYSANYSRYAEDGKALVNPIPFSQDALHTGEKMFGIYCTPCHGDGVTNGTVGSEGRFIGVIPLAGKLGAAKKRTDGYIYLTIRNGGAIMPYYGWAMTDEEMWSIVHYVRTLPNSAAPIPEPPKTETVEAVQ